MAQLTLGTLLTEVQDYIPGKPIAQISRAANQVLRRLYRELNFTNRSTFTTTTPYSTGTVSVALGSTSVTSAGATWTSGVTVLIRITGSDTWFSLTTTSTSAGTLSSAWAETSVSGGTYEMAFPFVVFGAAVLYPTRLYMEGYSELRFASDENRGWFNDPSRPIFFVPLHMDTAATPDDAYRIQLLPPPDDAYVVNFVYKIRPTYFGTSVGDKSAIPAMFDDVILYGTLFHCWDQEDKQDRSSYWKALYEQALMEARAEWAALQVTRLGGSGGAGDTYEDWPVAWSDSSLH